MRFIPVTTRPVLPPKDDIYSVLSESLPRLIEGDVLFITSKVIAIHQGRCIAIDSGVAKSRLVKKEADRYALSHLRSWKDLYLTIKGHTLIANAGIDESNANGYYVLWPKRPSPFAKEICNFLKRRYNLEKFAVIVTDSHIVPLRQGTLGISIGFFGMEPTYDYRGTPDIFGRLLKHTKKNIVDALSAMAVLLMGEGDERTPILILRDAKFITFTTKETYRKSVVALKNDLYSPFWRNFK
ncbi:MAG: coenzyme F420-0:L-glutamate ligase [Terracidiphilus sp.]|jgi:F420-0:gamma-glutamyl ligase